MIRIGTMFSCKMIICRVNLSKVPSSLDPLSTSFFFLSFIPFKCYPFHFGFLRVQQTLASLQKPARNP